MCCDQAISKHPHSARQTGHDVPTTRNSRRTSSSAGDDLSSRPPALQVHNDDFEEPPPEWAVIAEQRADIKKVLPSVGRIHQNGVTLGTGFVVAPDVVMTNRHVAESFGTDVDGILRLRIGWHPVIDFSSDQRAASRARYPIASILYADPEYDLALLWVPLAAPEPATSDLATARSKAATTSAEPAPRHPLPLATVAPKAEKRPVYLVGFPDEDPFATADEVFRVFQNIFDVKRVQPGYVNRVLIEDAVLGHTCSTLRGNSGSPVIDAETHVVLGVQTRGSREAANERPRNESIGLWLLPRHLLDLLEHVRTHPLAEPAMVPATTR